MRRLASSSLLLAFVALGVGAACGGRTSLPEERGHTSAGGSSTATASSAAAGGGSPIPLLPHAIAAALYVSCIPTEIDTNQELFSINQVGGISSGADACLVAHAAEGCAAFDDCFGITTKSDPNCMIGCDGSKAVGCYAGTAIETDCAKQGLLCESGACAPTPDIPCDASTFVATCVNGTATSCDGYLHSTSCTAESLICVVGSSETFGAWLALCVGEGAACKGPVGSGDPLSSDPLECKDKAIVYCANGHEHDLDCDGVLAGSMCMKSANGFGLECGYGDACSTFDPASCDGTSVVLCDAGAVTRVDCTTLGFTACSNGRCVNPTP